MIRMLLNCSTRLTVVAMDVESRPKVSCHKVLSYVLGLSRISIKILHHVNFE